MTKGTYSRRGRAVSPALILPAVFLAAVFLAGALLALPAAAIGTEKQGSDNPLSGDPKAIAEGQAAFRGGFCTNCHGMNANGRGRGAANAANLQKFKRGYSAFVQTVKEGYKTMPAWGGGPVLDDETINKIGAWLETLAQPEAIWRDPK